LAVVPSLISELTALAPSLIIFDKDGTLIDINTMWGGWITELAQRLEVTTGLSIARPLFKTMAFDPASGAIAPSGPLSIAPLAEQRKLVSGVLREAGLSPAESEAAIATAWYMPDPVALAQPLADLRELFGLLRAHRFKLAIATSDDRAPTEATLAGLEIAPLADEVVCADDGLPLKPAPDMILTICRSLNILPARTVMVGDNVDDLRMGRAAGVGLTIGVLSGVSSMVDLAPEADIVLNSVAGLIIKN
jgi:phosphoglycolate phosphatase-like HAD superfamily hydrolase